MKNKTEQIKKLTWKYFWEQKGKELLKFFGILRCIIIVIGILILINNYVAYPIGKLINGSYCEDNHIDRLQECKVVDCLAGWFIGGMILILVSIIIFCIIDWLLSNWKKAKARAMKEVNRK